MKKFFENQDSEMIMGIVDNSTKFEHQRLETVIDYLCDQHRQKLIDRLGLLEPKNQELEKSTTVIIEIDNVKITINK